jgi:hypothetical protein
VLRKIGMTSAGQADLGGGRLADLHEISRATWEALV